MNYTLQKAKNRPEYMVSLAFLKTSERLLEKGISPPVLQNLKGAVDMLESYLDLQKELTPIDDSDDKKL